MLDCLVGARGYSDHPWPSHFRAIVILPMYGSVPSLLVEPSTFRLPKVGALKRKADATDMDVGSADFAGAKISLLRC
jgi:hypothetical protein